MRVSCVHLFGVIPLQSYYTVCRPRESPINTGSGEFDANRLILSTAVQQSRISDICPKIFESRHPVYAPCLHFLLVPASARPVYTQQDRWQDSHAHKHSNTDVDQRFVKVQDPTTRYDARQINYCRQMYLSAACSRQFRSCPAATNFKKQCKNFIH